MRTLTIRFPNRFWNHDSFIISIFKNIYSVTNFATMCKKFIFLLKNPFIILIPKKKYFFLINNYKYFFKIISIRFLVNKNTSVEAYSTCSFFSLTRFLKFRPLDRRHDFVLNLLGASIGTRQTIPTLFFFAKINWYGALILN